MVPDVFRFSFDEQDWEYPQAWRCNTSMTVSTHSLLECPSSVILHQAIEFELQCFQKIQLFVSLQAHEIGTNVLDPNTLMTPPDVDFMSVSFFFSKSASWTNPNLQLIARFRNVTIRCAVG